MNSKQALPIDLNLNNQAKQVAVVIAVVIIWVSFVTLIKSLKGNS